MKYDLTGCWKFKDVEGSEWLDAIVPGCNYLDLMRLNKIADPFYGTNEKDCYWVSLKDWEYSKTFSLSKSFLAHSNIVLNADMIDTIANVYVNDSLVVSLENCFITNTINVKKYLVEGDNVIRILIKSPVKYVEEKQSILSCPRNCNGQNGIPWIRKPQSHFGWDWGPVLPSSGITKYIGLEAFDIASLKEINIKQLHNEDKSVDLLIDAKLDDLTENKSTWELNIIGPNNEKVGVFKGNDLREIHSNCKIENPELWWTKELSNKDIQPLYTVKLILSSDGFEDQIFEKKIGLRTITLNTERDEFGKNFQFILNGVPIFVKGANWIPVDSFITRFDKSKIESLILDALNCNMNMLRVWGGGYYESEDFYNACDKYGLLVWQDFCFACQAYPFFNENYLKLIKKEVENILLRIRTHASLAILAGNNEIESMAINWINRPDFIKWTEKFFYNILPEEVKKFVTDVPFIPGTPCGIGHNNGFDKDNVGDTHLWAVWHGLQPLDYYRKRNTRFCSEFGFESLPDITTIEKFAEQKDYNLNSEVFKAHQKCLSGNNKMVYYITSRFRLPKKFDDYIYLSQICQMECVKDATYHWRMNKGRCNGSMYWQYNDCWPVCSWASLDYYGNYKALQYSAKEFFAPLTLGIDFNDNKLVVYILNDTLKSYNLLVKTKVMNIEGKVYETICDDCSVKQNENFVVMSRPINEITRKLDLKDALISCELYSNGELITKQSYIFEKEKNIKLHKTQVAVDIEIKDNTAYIKLKSDFYVRFLRVSSRLLKKPLSKNYFDLIPNEEEIIQVSLDKNYTKEELLGSIELFSVADVTPKSSKLYDWMVKTRILLMPVNFFSWMFNKHVPEDAKLK